MGSDDTGRGESTRREYVKGSAALLDGGLLAGCTGQSDQQSTPTETAGDAGTTSGTDTTAATENTETTSGFWPTSSDWTTKR